MDRFQENSDRQQKVGHLLDRGLGPLRRLMVWGNFLIHGNPLSEVGVDGRGLALITLLFSFITPKPLLQASFSIFFVSDVLMKHYLRHY
jgi:hypothetical protein